MFETLMSVEGGQICTLITFHYQLRGTWPSERIGGFREVCKEKHANWVLDYKSPVLKQNTVEHNQEVYD